MPLYDDFTVWARSSETAIPSCLKTASEEDIADVIADFLQSNTASSVTAIKSVLTRLTSCESHSEARLLFLRSCILALRSRLADGAAGRELTCLLVGQLHSISSQHISTLLADFLKLLRSSATVNDRWLEVFVQLMTALSTCTRLSIGERSMSGEEARRQVLDTVCSLCWTPDTIVHLVRITVEQPALDLDQIQQVMDVVSEQVDKVGYDQMPSLVYQLLRFGQQKVVARVLGMVFDYFAKRNEGAGEDSNNNNNNNNDSEIDIKVDIDCDEDSPLVQCQAVVIYHVSRAASVDGCVARELVQHVQRCSTQPRSLLAPFPLALFLALISVDTCRQPVLAAIIGALRRVTQQQQLYQHYSFMRKLVQSAAGTVGNNNNNNTGGGSTCLLVNTLLKRLASRCSAGWEPVTDGLLQLLLAMMGGTAAAGGGSSSSCSLTEDVLALLCRNQPAVVPVVLTHLVNSLGEIQSCDSHVTALAAVITSCAVSVVEQRSLLTELVERIGLLPVPVASRVLAALLPVIKLCHSLRAALLNRLRRLLSSKRLQWRLVAVHGCLLLLRHFRVAGSLPFSQASQNFSCAMSQVVVCSAMAAGSQSQRAAVAAHEALCLQVLGAARRSLTHQSVVRCTLYNGLHEVLSRNPELSEYVLGLLLQRTQTLVAVDGDGTVVSLRLSDCLTPGDNETSGTITNVDTSSVVCEPLPSLLAALSACASRVLHVHEGVDQCEGDAALEVVSANKATSLLDALIGYMVGAELSDLGVVKNQVSCQLRLISGVYVALMDHVCRRCTAAKLDLNSITVLRSLYSRFKATTVTKTTTKKGGKQKKSDSATVDKSTPGSNPVSSDFVVRVSLRSIAKFVVWLSEENTIGSDDQNMARHFLSDMRHLIGELRASGECKGAEGANWRHVLEILPVLVLGLCRIAERDELSELCAVCAETILDTVSTLRDRDAAALSSLLDNFRRENGDCLQSVCQQIIAAGVSARAMAPLCQLLLVLVEVRPPLDTEHVTPSSGDCEQQQQRGGLHAWVRQLMEQPPRDDPVTCRHCVSLCLQLADRGLADHKLSQQLCQQLPVQLGRVGGAPDTDNNNTVSANSNSLSVSLCVVNDSSVSVCVLALCRHITGWLDAVDWCLTSWRTSLITSVTSNQNASTEQQLCAKLISTVLCLAPIVESALPRGVNTEAALRVVARFYHVMTSLVRGYLTKVKHAKLPRSAVAHRFERLAQSCGRHLTGHVYDFISYTGAGGGGPSEGSTSSASSGSTNRASVFRVGSLTASLIGNMELYESLLVQLITAAHLPISVKPSTSRDFRINQSALGAALQSQQDDQSDSSENESGGEQSSARSAKRMKKSG